jgi:hypothetical protein
MKISERRKLLVKAIRTHCFPFLEAKGFTKLPNLPHRRECFDLVRVGDKKIDCLTFQFESHGWPHFKVPIAEGPVNGVTIYDGTYVPGNELRTYHCPGAKACLYGRHKLLSFGYIYLFGWFKPQRSLLIKPEDAAVECSMRFNVFFSECEAWWRDKTFGSHLSAAHFVPLPKHLTNLKHE